MSFRFKKQLKSIRENVLICKFIQKGLWFMEDSDLVINVIGKIVIFVFYLLFIVEIKCISQKGWINIE